MHIRATLFLLSCIGSFTTIALCSSSSPSQRTLSPRSIQRYILDERNAQAIIGLALEGGSVPSSVQTWLQSHANTMNRLIPEQAAHIRNTAAQPLHNTASTKVFTKATDEKTPNINTKPS